MKQFKVISNTSETRFNNELDKYVKDNWIVKEIKTEKTRNDIGGVFNTAIVASENINFIAILEKESNDPTKD